MSDDSNKSDKSAPEKAPASPSKKAPKLDNGPRLTENGSFLPAAYLVGEKKHLVRRDK